ncbi:hypothetical protein ACFLT1_08485 [Bacteroidota bacterium]
MFEKLSPKPKSNQNSFLLKDTSKNLNISSSLYEGAIKSGEVEVPCLCINCEEKYCFQYSLDEIDHDILEGLPHNNDLRVCPANAIVLNEDNTLEINSNCFSCGLCVYRCPIGGIRIDRGKSFKAEFFTDSSQLFAKSDLAISVHDVVNQVVSKDNIKFSIDPQHLSRVYRLLEVHSKRIQDFDLILTRNLFIGLGIANKVSAKGNNDNRFDFLGLANNKYLLGEVDFKGSDFLSLNRRILEDITVLNNRYDKEINSEILPLLIILGFPNKRSDYYEVTKDIKDVLGIKIYTLPVHILLLFQWNHFLLDDSILESFYVDIDNMSIEDTIKELIDDIHDIDPYFGNNFYKYLK